MARTINLSVSGMHCVSCVGRVERELSQLPGVNKARVSLADERASVIVDENAYDTALLIDAVEVTGYQAEIIEG